MMIATVFKRSPLRIGCSCQFRTKVTSKPVERVIINEGERLAPMYTGEMFNRVFMVKHNMQSLINSAIESGRLTDVKKLTTIHRIDHSVITPDEERPEHVCEPSTLYDCWCSFDDSSVGSFKLIRTSDFDAIPMDVSKCAELEYSKQWNDQHEFTQPVRAVVLNFGCFAVQAPAHKNNQFIHVDAGLPAVPPPAEYCSFNISNSNSLPLCTDDFERWCYLIHDSKALKGASLPLELQSEPFKSAVDLLDMRYYTDVDIEKVKADALKLNMEYLNFQKLAWYMSYKIHMIIPAYFEDNTRGGEAGKERKEG